MLISGIVAMAQNRVIGKQNQLPWHLPADLKHFKDVTMGKPILMGRKTYDSIGRALPGRCNVIITRDNSLSAPGCIVANSIETALTSVAYEDEVFVIGGAALFQQMLDRIQRFYFTIIHEDIDGDVSFPEIDLKQWQEVSREKFSADQHNPYSFSFVMMDRI